LFFALAFKLKLFNIIYTLNKFTVLFLTIHISFIAFLYINLLSWNKSSSDVKI
jgi:hypothetical protein